MAKAVLVVGAVIVLGGAFGVVAPLVFRGWAGAFRSRPMLYVAALVRLSLGVLLLLAAPACRFTVLIQVLGVVVIFAVVVMFMLGQQRIDAMFDWWGRQSATIVRAWATVAVILGAVLIFAAV